MTTAAFDLVTRLLARGIALEPDGGTLVVRPARAVRPEELEALRRLKPEVIALLRTAPPKPRVALDPMAVHETLGAHPDPHELARLHSQVVAAVVDIGREIQTGSIAQRPCLVRGRPLSDWLDLADLAALLGAWGRR